MSTATAISQRQQLEDEIIARLKLSIGRPTSPTGYVRLIEPYNGEIDETDGPEDIREALRGRVPAILVTANVSMLRSISVTKALFRRTISFELYCVSDHLRSPKSRLRADAAHQTDSRRDPGIYKMVEDIAETLQGQPCLVPGAGPLMPSREDVLLQRPDFTAWRLQYDCTVDSFNKPFDYSETDLLSIGLEGDLTDGDIDGEDAPNPIVQATVDVS